MFQRHITCPVCLFEFDTYKMHTNAPKVLKREPDFYTTYVGENPTHYSIYVCPTCGYAAFEKDFKEVSDEAKAIIYQKITQQWNHRNFCGMRSPQDALDTYKLALLCYSLTKASHLTIGKITMRIAWIYRELGDPKEKDFLKFTVDHFEKAFTTENMTDDLEEEITILFLLGEFHRQLGNLVEAVRWFSKALEIPEIKKKRHLEQRVRAQWSLVSESYRTAKE
jgi:hypothetical protein